MSRKPLALAVVLPLLACGLSACGGDEKGGSANGGSQTTTATPKVEKKLTDEQLSAMLKKVSIDGKTLQVMPDKYLAEAKKGGEVVAQSMADATVEPAACKTATVDAAKAIPGDVPMGGAGNDNLVIMVRTLGSAEDGTKIIEANRRTAKECASYTMTMKDAGSMKGTSEEVKIDSATSEDETMQVSGVEVSGSKMTTVTALGHVGNILIQVTDMGGKSNAETMGKAIEAVAKQVVAEK